MKRVNAIDILIRNVTLVWNVMAMLARFQTMIAGALFSFYESIITKIVFT